MALQEVTSPGTSNAERRELVVGHTDYRLSSLNFSYSEWANLGGEPDEEERMSPSKDAE